MNLPRISKNPSSFTFNVPSSFLKCLALAGYFPRLWIPSSCHADPVRNFRRGPNAIFTRGTWMLFWRRTSFKIPRAWNLQVQYLKISKYSNSYWSMLLSLTFLFTTSKNIFFGALRLQELIKVFLASGCPIKFPSSRAIKPESYSFVGMTLATASFKLPTRRSWKNANALPTFIGETCPSMNFVEAKLWSAWTKSWAVLDNTT